MAVPEFYSGKVLYPAIAVLIALSALFGLAIMPRLAPGGGKMVGKPAPDVTMPVVANGDPGARMRLSDLKGSAVVLDFWATWCGPCAVQAPILDRIARRHKKRGLVVLGVNVDDPPDVAREFAEKKGLSYPIVTDPSREASMQYGVDKLPSLIVINKEGKVIAFLTGIVDEAALDEVISAAL
ncbi:MAG TPA: TlpA disulfide reductase family protein [Polyangiaceae bacterium]|jgi:peroxiredoxin|nr:TlpA disulfide reductase family protein [Polyangiaceae bacterium]